MRLLARFPQAPARQELEGGGLRARPGRGPERMFANELRRAVEASPRCERPRQRRPFTPTPAGTYRFPRSVHERLTTVLEPYKNRDEAYALALLLGRCWSNADRIDLAFPVVRRTGEAKGQGTWGGLCDVAALGLSQGRVRGARALLERIEFLARTIPPNRSKHRATEEGLRRKPVLFTFGAEYRTAFKAANARALAARQARSGERRTLTVAPPLLASTAHFSRTNLPKDKSPPGRTVFMGKLETGKRTPLRGELAPKAGAASPRWLCEEGSAKIEPHHQPPA